jgi:hypothetical protein
MSVSFKCLPRIVIHDDQILVYLLVAILFLRICRPVTARPSTLHAGFTAVDNFFFIPSIFL